MKTLLSTLAAAAVIITVSSCTKAPMPVPEESIGISTVKPGSALNAARFYDSTRFITRDAAAPPPKSAY